MKTLSETAKALLNEIRIATDEASVAALRSDFEGKDGWEELVEADMVNCWEDDTEMAYVEEGRQQ